MLPPYPHPTIHPAPYLKAPGQYETAVEILRKAYQLILVQEEDFICCAISEATSGMPYPWTSTGAELKDWIRLMLISYQTLEGWLRDNYDVDIEDTPEYLEAIRETRLRWILSMIAKLEG